MTQTITSSFDILTKLREGAEASVCRRISSLRSLSVRDEPETAIYQKVRCSKFRRPRSVLLNFRKESPRTHVIIPSNNRHFGKSTCREVGRHRLTAITLDLIPLTISSFSPSASHSSRSPTASANPVHKRKTALLAANLLIFTFRLGKAR
jgi:hypothetical protein